MHQYLVQWDGDEVEVVPADDSSEVSLADMNAWDAEGQEPISGVALEDCDRIKATKNGLRLVLSTGLTEKTRHGMLRGVIKLERPVPATGPKK